MAWLNSKKRVHRETGRKEIYWSVAWRDATGKMHTRAIGFCSAAEAKKALKVFEGKQAAGEAPDAPAPTSTATGSSRARPSAPSVREYLDRVYLPVVARDKAPKTYETFRNAAVALKGWLGELSLHDVNFAGVDAYVSERRKLGRRARTIILELRCLAGMLRHAADCGLLSGVPKLPKLADRDRRPHRFLTAEESVALLDALRPLDEQPHRVTRGAPPVRRDRLTFLAVLMALNLGARRNEILSRGWEDVRWTMGPLGALLIGAKPELGFQVKTRRDRTVPLTPELRAELQLAWTEAGEPPRGWIFPSPDDAARPRRDFGIALKRACGRAQIPEIHPHGLRHTWASRLAMAGVDRRTLMELGGWKEGRMLDEIYAHVTDAHMAEVMARSGIAARGGPTRAACPVEPAADEARHAVSAVPVGAQKAGGPS